MPTGKAYVPSIRPLSPEELAAIEDELLGLYAQTAEDLLAIIKREDVTSWRKAWSKQHLNQVRDALASLNAETDAWASANIPSLYEHGLAVADAYLMAPEHVPLYQAARAQGLDHFAAVAEVNKLTGDAGPGGLSVAAHPGQVTPMDLGFTRMHREAVLTLTENIVKPLGEANAYVGQHIESMMARAKLLTKQYGGYAKSWDRQERIRDASLRTMQQAFARGDTPQQAEKAFLEALRKRGITSFVDRAGRQWDMTTYAQTVVPQAASEAQRHGLENRLIERGQDLVQVTGTRSSAGLNTCDACKRYAGRVLSLTGETPGYPLMNTALDEGLFHPHCHHSSIPYIEEYMA